MPTKIIATIFLGFVFVQQGFAKPTLNKPGIRVTNYHDFSFLAHKCWNVGGASTFMADNVAINPTSKCPKTEQGTWGMGVDFYDSHYTSKEYLRFNKIGHTIVQTTTKLVDGRLTYFGKEVFPESDLQADKINPNYIWSGVVVCGDQRFSLFYGDHLDKKAREHARKDQSMPAVYLELLNSFKCPPKVDYERKDK